MGSLVERVKLAHAKVKDLRANEARLARSLAQLELRHREMDREREVLRSRVQELEQENEVLRNEKAALRPAREGTKEKIDELVHEIDRCLALLNP